MRQSPPDLTPKINLAVLVFLLCCLLSSFREVTDAPIQLESDTIAKRSDQRFSALKAALPPGGVVGYMGESGNSGTADYYLAQYALVPLVLDHSSDHPLVIGNFTAASKPTGSPDNLQLLKDFGNGVLLYANKDAK